MLAEGSTRLNLNQNEYASVELGGELMPDNADPRAYLETEARIIAENDTHAVIALRIEKAAIYRNLPLLAALSDLLPSQHERAPFYTPPGCT